MGFAIALIYVVGAILFWTWAADNKACVLNWETAYSTVFWPLATEVIVLGGRDRCGQPIVKPAKP